MDSEGYQWVAHQVAVQRIIQLPAAERHLILERISQFAEAPHMLASEKGFSLSNHAPYFVVAVNRRLLTLQVDHAVKELRLLAVE